MLPFQPLHTSVEGIRFYKNVMIPMRDGKKLAMDLYIPNVNGPHPVILTYIPYRKDDLAPFTGMQYFWAQHGFIGARIDCRGTGSSEGINDDEYRTIEQQDGFDAIEWIADQNWCDGKIAMTGGSYGGFTCVQIAALAPPHLVTIIPWNFTDDRYTDDCHYRGGAWRCYYDIGSYGCSMVGMNAMPPYPEYSGADWSKIWEEHLAQNNPYLLVWLSNQIDGEYWRSGSIRNKYKQIKTSALLIGGWRDGYCNAPLRTSKNMTAQSKVVIGPWNHSGPDCETPGPSLSREHLTVRWCEYWLKGIDNGIMDEPKINVYVQKFDKPNADRTQTSGYWRTEQKFPIPGTEQRKFKLGEDLILTNYDQTQGNYEEYEYRPSVGITSGLWSAGVPFGLPSDQRLDETYSVNYTSEFLEDPVEIIGMPKAVLHVSSTAPVMAFVARLSDVAPDGTSAQVTIGVLNGTRRNSFINPEPLKPGEVYKLNLDLDTTAWRFEKGHRIRLSISSADFPNLWPTPYLGSNRIYREAGKASFLELPVVPIRRANEGEMPLNEIVFQTSTNPRLYPQCSPDEIPWEITHDMLRDRTGLKLRLVNENPVNKDMMVKMENTLEVWTNNREPEKTSAIGKHLRTITRIDGVINVDTCSNVRSTKDSIHVTIDLDVRINGLPHHQRKWVQSFKRELL